MKTNEAKNLIRCLRYCLYSISSCPHLKDDIEYCEGIGSCITADFKCQAINECKYLAKALQDIGNCEQIEPKENIF